VWDFFIISTPITKIMLRFIQKYLSRLYVPIVWTLIILVLMCTPGNYIPSEQGFFVPDFDKVIHMGVFAGFVFLWSLYQTTRRPPFKRLLLGFFCFYMLGNLFGIGIEYAQKYWIPGRDYDLADIIADMFGAGIGYGLSNLWLLPGADKKIA
jgi:VanZ family protein